MILSAIWGSAFIAIKISLNTFNPTTIASLRLIIASFFLFFFFFFKKYDYHFSIQNFYFLFLVGLIGNFIPFLFISWAEQYIQSSTAGILMSIGPIMTLILSHFFTKDDKFTFLKFISILIGLIGVFFIFDFQNFFNLNSDNKIKLFAKILVVLAASGYMISNIIAYNKLEKINTLAITTFATFFGALVSIPFMVFGELTNPSNISLNSLLAIVYLGLFPTAIAFQFRYYITKKSGPVFLSYVAYLIPGFAVLWGYLLLGENITLNSLIGILLVLFGVYIGQKKLMNKVR